MQEILEEQRRLVMLLQGKARELPTSETLSALQYAISGLRDLELLMFELSQPRQTAI